VAFAARVANVICRISRDTSALRHADASASIPAGCSAVDAALGAAGPEDSLRADGAEG
jgi:hypothetical protein